MILNAILGHMAEFGIVVPQGARRVGELIDRVRREECRNVPQIARQAILAIASQLDGLEQEIGALERELKVWHRDSACRKRLGSRSIQVRSSIRGFPGIGAETELERRQKPAWPHPENGEWLFAKAACDRCNIGPATRKK